MNPVKLYLPAASFGRLLITFSCQLNPEQAQQKLGLVWVETIKKNQHVTKKHASFPSKQVDWLDLSIN